MKVSFEGIGERVVTFYNSEANAAVPGRAVKMGAGGTAISCGDGDAFAGFCIDAQADTATVQVGGFVTAKYTGEAPAAGFCRLCADAGGGVRADAAGREYLVFETDAAAKTVGFMM